MWMKNRVLFLILGMLLLQSSILSAGCFKDATDDLRQIWEIVLKAEGPTDGWTSKSTGEFYYRGYNYTYQIITGNAVQLIPEHNGGEFSFRMRNDVPELHKSSEKDVLETFPFLALDGPTEGDLIEKAQDYIVANGIKSKNIIERAKQFARLENKLQSLEVTRPEIAQTLSELWKLVVKNFPPKGDLSEGTLDFRGDTFQVIPFREKLNVPVGYSLISHDSGSSISIHQKLIRDLKKDVMFSYSDFLHSYLTVFPSGGN